MQMFKELQFVGILIHHSSVGYVCKEKKLRVDELAHCIPSLDHTICTT